MTYSEDLLNFFTTNDNYNDNEIKPLPINLINEFENEYEYEYEIYNFLLIFFNNIFMKY